MIKILLKSIKDILSVKVLGFIIKVTLGAFLLMILFFWFFWDSFSNAISHLVLALPFIGKFSFVQEAASFLGALVVAYGIIIALISLLTSIFSPKLILSLAKKEYNIEGKENSSLKEVIWVNVKTALIFVLLLFLCLPLIFVPILGQIVMLLLWAYLLKEPTYLDVASLFDGIKKEKSGLWIIAIIAAVFNYIPFLNLFAPVFAQILFMHYLLSQKS